MLNIITNPRYKGDKIIINDVEAFFYNEANEIIRHKEFKSVIKAIDDADVIIDGVIKTKFGVATARELSTGSKALLIALSYPQYITNMTEAGNNVLSLLVTLSKQYDLNILLNKGIPTSDLDYVITVNDKQMTMLEFVSEV